MKTVFRVIALLGALLLLAACAQTAQSASNGSGEPSAEPALSAADATYGKHDDLAANPYHTMDDDGNYVEAPQFTSAQEAVASVVNVPSLVDMYILQEICQDNDIAWSSFYFSLDMSPEGDHLLTYTAPWDFDSGFGSTNTTNTALYAMESDNPWLVVWYGQDWFWQLVKARWDEAKEAGVFSGILDYIDSCATLYADAYAKNFSLWNTLENPVEGFTKGYKTHAEAAAQLKSWLSGRFDNLERLFNERAK